jgi:hypothetical protein
MMMVFRLGELLQIKIQLAYQMTKILYSVEMFVLGAKLDDRYISRTNR